jgi:hypothetical protein
VIVVPLPVSKSSRVIKKWTAEGQLPSNTLEPGVPRDGGGKGRFWLLSFGSGDILWENLYETIRDRHLREGARHISVVVLWWFKFWKGGRDAMTLKYIVIRLWCCSIVSTSGRWTGVIYSIVSTGATFCVHNLSTPQSYQQWRARAALSVENQITGRCCHQYRGQRSPDHIYGIATKATYYFQLR